MDFDGTEPPRKPALPVQILAVIGYTGFAIPVSIVAILEFGVLGLALAAFLGWQWTRVLALGAPADAAAAADRLSPRVSSPDASSGNASFDAYRSTLVQRLEEEQQGFEDFLSRLRDAKDRTEFDSFLAERETKAVRGDAVVPS